MREHRARVTATPRASVRGGRTLFGLAVLAGLASSAIAAPPDVPRISGGQRIAQRECGACHAVAGGASPLADAPPFRELWRRYGKGGLDALLQEGMVRPRQMLEEGSPRSHPRMPMTDLDDDQVAQLKAYLRSLEPKRPQT